MEFRNACVGTHDSYIDTSITVKMSPVSHSYKTACKSENMKLHCALRPSITRDFEELAAFAPQQNSSAYPSVAAKYLRHDSEALRVTRVRADVLVAQLVRVREIYPTRARTQCASEHYCLKKIGS